MADDKVHFRCPHCDRKLRISAAHAGRRVRCPRCEARIVVPPLPSEPALAAESSARPHDHESGLPDLYPSSNVEQNIEGWIDMTAMVDIVFFLLIFFMVTSLNTQQASIDMPVPRLESASAPGARGQRTAEQFEADPDVVVVRIDEDDTVWIDREEILALVELPGRIRTATEPARPGGEQKKVLVLASGDAHHGTAVAVLDAAREGGATGLSIAVEGDE